MSPSLPQAREEFQQRRVRLLGRLLLVPVARALDQDLRTQIVAERVGYSTEDALGRAFKRHMGMSVGEWRRARMSAS